MSWKADLSNAFSPKFFLMGISTLPTPIATKICEFEWAAPNSAVHNTQDEGHTWVWGLSDFKNVNFLAIHFFYTSMFFGIQLSNFDGSGRLASDAWEPFIDCKQTAAYLNEQVEQVLKSLELRGFCWDFHLVYLTFSNSGHSNELTLIGPQRALNPSFCPIVYHRLSIHLVFEFRSRQKVSLYVRMRRAAAYNNRFQSFSDNFVISRHLKPKKFGARWLAQGMQMLSKESKLGLFE